MRMGVSPRGQAAFHRQSGDCISLVVAVLPPYLLISEFPRLAQRSKLPGPFVGATPTLKLYLLNWSDLT